jgi:hypothetical protein
MLGPALQLATSAGRHVDQHSSVCWLRLPPYIRVQLSKGGKYTASCCPICFNDFVPSSLKPPSDTSSDVTQPPSDGASTSSPPPSIASANVSETVPLLPKKEPKDKAASDAQPIGSVLPFLLPCGHAFCEQCISKWLKDKQHCPSAHSASVLAPVAAPNNAFSRREGRLHNSGCQSAIRGLSAPSSPDKPVIVGGELAQCAAVSRGTLDSCASAVSND